MSQKGEWIANCLPDRVERIRSASIFLLRTGPPIPNQLQTQEDLIARGLVGLYRVGKKKDDEVAAGQRTYLETSPFTPQPGLLRDFMGTGPPEEPGST